MRYFIFIITLTLIIKVLFFSVGEWSYNFDEIIVADISTQPMSQLFRTITTEPHPPLFYLVLKNIPGDAFTNPIMTKVFASLLNFLLWLVVVFYMQNKHLLKNGTIFWGMSLFLSSYFVVSSGSLLKQDLVTLPTFVLYFFTSLYLLFGLRPGKRDLILNFFLFFMLMLSGYLYFIFSLLMFFAVWAKYRRRSLVNILNVVAVFSSFVLYQLITSKQIVHNTGRFTWLRYSDNSIFTSFTNYLVGLREITEYNSVIVLFFLFLVFFALWVMFIKKRTVFFISTAVSCLIILISTEYKLFVRDRYSILFHIVLTFLAGYGLGKLAINDYAKKTLVVFLFLVPSTSFFIVQMVSINKFSASLKGIVVEERTILVTQKPIDSFIYKRAYYDKNSDIIPASPEVEYETWDGHIDFDILSKEGHYKVMSKTETEDWLKRQMSSSFVYIGASEGIKTYYDPNNITKGVLDGKCNQKETLFNLQKIYIYRYSDCFKP